MSEPRLRLPGSGTWTARRYGTSVLESMIVGGVAAANAAYRDSGVGITLRLVDLQRAATVSESPDGMIATLACFQAAPEVAQLREQLGADMTLLVNENDVRVRVHHVPAVHLVCRGRLRCRTRQVPVGGIDRARTRPPAGVDARSRDTECRRRAALRPRVSAL